ncbi:hypothetical protein [Ekhidna sp.]|uniref:hypothetical protein n=1 Tax=Ekhidna sp. TaxID=2608089 RepID=UPI003CCBBF21
MKRIEDIIDEALKTEPTFQLSRDFKDRIIQTVRKKERSSQRKLYLWMALGTLVIIGFGYATIAYFMPSTLESFESIKTGNKVVPLAVLAGLLIVVIQYLDKRLVKDKILHV